ncbi:SHOCT domain-containing protein [Candidatus Thioglobus sp.]|nr:SHOCT domain-containing protein [Candidatus Thioglobus sp.]MDB9803086.1 SHOCT domain-containing protein [Candidatus Thioglobus sp.]
MKKLLLLLMLSISYVSYAADFTCNISPAIGFSSGSLDCTEEKEIDYKAAGKGLRILFDWLNENSTTNTNSNNNSVGSIPRNAYSYKNTWKCYDGYKKSGNRCTKQSYKIPQNAFRTKGTWKCLASFVKSGNTCIKVPANGYASGNSFKCLTGYQNSGSRCVKKRIPLNAVAYDDSWKCIKGFFRKNANYCALLPSNSYALMAGGWRCNNGFSPQGNSCVKNIEVPPNAYASGSGWNCKSGYYKSSNSCQKLPANSYAPQSGGSWECNYLYTRSGNRCIKEEDKIEESIETSQEDSSDYLEKIKQAKVLLDSGVITEDEFKDIKKKIIDNI